MILKSNGITDIESWFNIAPPMEGTRQWKDGRSAKELARYITNSLPHMPKEIEATLLHFTKTNAELEWAAEYTTKLQPHGLGKGNGRCHDAFMFNSEIVVGIEGKADEPLGSKLIGEELKNANDNKRLRINGMIQMLFGDAPEKHESIRYQLVTASAATLIEAAKRCVSKAMLMVITFKKEGCYKSERIAANKADIQRFLTELSARQENDYFVLPTPYGSKNGIELYFKHIEINVD